jgi:stearoyl-CoA desaturase (Delta-9 desaturase)
LGVLMHLELSLFTGIVPREWAAVHRKHHRFSDKEGDPHSPYCHGFWTVLFGNIYLYQREAHDRQVIAKYTPDWKDDVLDYVPGFKVAAPLAGMGFAMLAFGPRRGLAAYFSHVALYAFLNAFINCICHMLGYRNFENTA